MQQEFDFESASTADSYERWVSERHELQKELARKNGVPLGHVCRVELTSGIEVTGMLCLAEDKAPMMPSRNPELELRIDRCRFQLREVAAIVRVD